jgi:predicted phage tail protein
MTALNGFWHRNRKAPRKRVSDCRNASLQCERYGFDHLEARLLLTASAVAETRQPAIAGFVSTVAVPATPTNLVVTPANGRVTLTWSAPVNRTLRSDYEVQYSSDNGASWTTFSLRPSPRTTAIVTGLSNGTSYVFHVATINAFGKSAYSANSSPVVPASAPAVPTNLTATPGNTKAMLQWTVPPNGGSPITNYAIQYSTNGRSWTTFARTASTATNATVTGLTNGRNYVFRVSAINGMGMGAFTQKTNAVKPPITVPGKPDSFAWSSGWKLVWSSPDNGGSPITAYTIRTSTDNGASWSTLVANQSLPLVNGKVEWSVPALVNVPRKFEVTARNSVGFGSPAVVTGPCPNESFPPCGSGFG